MHVHGIQTNQDPNRHKRDKTNKTEPHRETETQRQTKQVKQRLEHVNKTKGKRAERIKVFWAGICVCIHKACLCSSIVCVRISQVCKYMHEACMHIHTQNTKT